MFGLWAYDLNINFPHTSNLKNLYRYHKLKSKIYYIYQHRWTFILLSCLRFYFFFFPIAFELYPLYHYKQTNNQTNKQTKTNKTKQSKTKQKTKTKISFRLLEWAPLTLFVKSYFFACRCYKELSLLFIQQSYLRLFTLTGSEGNTAPMASSPIHVTSTWIWHWRRRL